MPVKVVFLIMAGVVGIHWVQRRDLFSLPTGLVHQVVEQSFRVQALQSGQLLELIWGSLPQPVLRLEREFLQVRQDRVTELEHMVHDGINTERVSDGGLPLKWDDQLAALAGN